MTKTLTEQWRDGELKDGLYYCKSIYDIEELCLDDRYFWYPLQNEGEPIDVQEVLAPVPNYDEYKELVFKSNKPANPLSDCMMTYDTEREKEIVAPLLEQIKNQGLTIKNLQNKLEDAETRIEELEKQNGFECGCVASRDEQLKEANELIKDYGDEYPNVVSDYIKKWGVK